MMHGTMSLKKPHSYTQMWHSISHIFKFKSNLLVNNKLLKGMEGIYCVLIFN